MRYLRFLMGALIWRLRAGFWYLTLAFRLYFAIGLDRDFDPEKDGADMSRHFKCPYPRDYRRHLAI